MVLEDTLLFPEGGGQPSDKGRLNEVNVLDVREVDGTIYHTFVAMSTQIGFKLRKSAIFFINLCGKKIADILTALLEKKT